MTVAAMCLLIAVASFRLMVGGREAVRAYHDFKADRIVAERNFGGAMVEHVIRTIDPNVSFKEVTASRGKAVRAEPVAAFYEQQRIKHIEVFTALEDEMCAMTSNGFTGDGSPDRLDALVWAITELMIEKPIPVAQFGHYSWG
jgi:phage terminase large subunit-like protein